MSDVAELAMTVIAGAIGSMVAVLTLGASLLFIVPITVGVGAIALATGRGSRSRGARSGEPGARRRHA